MTPGLTGLPVAPERAATRVRLWQEGDLPLHSAATVQAEWPHEGQAPGAHACLKSGFPSFDLSRSFSVLLIKKAWFT